MKTEGNISKVAICPKCHGFVLACHVDFLQKGTEKEFTQFTNKGFVVQLETIEKTRSRDFSDYDVCVKKECKPNYPQNPTL